MPWLLHANSCCKWPTLADNLADNPCLVLVLTCMHIEEAGVCQGNNELLVLGLCCGSTESLVRGRIGRGPDALCILISLLAPDSHRCEFHDEAGQGLASSRS